MKRLLRIFAGAFVLAIIVMAVLLFQFSRNVKSEYATADAIYNLKEYVLHHDGRWPTTPEDLGGKYPIGGQVYLDYSVTSSRLIENPRLLRQSIRPRSSTFYIYPHYDEKINELYATLRATNPSEQSAAPNP